MKQFLLFIVLLFTVVVLAQQDIQPKRTPEELALKQTERLQRDLNLSASQRDTIYRIHLKYAEMRRQDEDRDVVAQRIQMMKSELIDVLTPEQSEVFMIKMREAGPKRQSMPRMKTAEAVSIEPAILQADTIIQEKTTD